MRNEKVNMKNEKLLEQYLEGKAPLHADRLGLPSDEELDAAEVEFDRVVAAAKRPARHLPLWPWAVGIAAAFVLAFLLWPKAVKEDDATPLAMNETPKTQQHEQEEQTLLAQQTEQTNPVTIKRAKRTPTNNNVDEPLEGQIAGLTIVPTSADLNTGVTMRLGGHCSMLLEGEETLAEEKVEEQQPSPIPPDKQALADIYLAEVALQVAYERQAQAEALRAYAASLTGEEEPEPIITF